MSDIRIKMAKDLRDMSDMVGDLHWMAAKAVEDLIKKDGEIAKRDEELAACRVAVENCEVFRARVDELEARIVWLECEAQVNAAPVSEAKAHGNYAPDSVVWIDAHHVIEGNNPSFIKDVALVSAERTSETQIPLARLNAAPAAPAADAGIVDMYRHLQKVTPYRFKKIQDASITDGGDVMYFHKDRFDAALLADMAAHCAAKGVV